MCRRVVRHCVFIGLLVVATAMALRTPGIWHAHVGGDAAHGHGRHAHSPDARERAANPAGQSHVHPQGTHLHSHHGHVHTHGGSSHSHGGGHTHSHPEHSREPPESSVSAEPAWHMHFSLLGFEMTLTWPLPSESKPPAARPPDDEHAQIARGQRNFSEPAVDVANSGAAQQRLTAVDPTRATLSLPVDRTAMRFLGIDFGPLPCHVALDAAVHSARLDFASPLQRGLDAQRPATPPPRARCAA